MPRKLAAALSILAGFGAHGLNIDNILTGEIITTSLDAFNVTKATDSACSALFAAYPTQILFPNSTNYLSETREFWDIRSNLHPLCIFFPQTGDDVAEAMRTVHASDAQFAVRGGGHMNYPGSNNIEGGVLIALSDMQALRVHNESIEVGPGARWYQVYNALEPYGRLSLGGRLKTIGVPGLTLIGGFHYFINKHGFVMDQVISYAVVLGNGTQVTANATTNRDLFWALKGGANNFGIVTKFVFRTYDIPRVSSTIQMYNETEIPAFIRAVTHLAEVDDPVAPIAAGGILTITYNTTTKAASASLLGLQEGVSRPPSQFANFTAIPGPLKVHNVTTAAQWASGLDSPNQMFRVMFSHHTIKPRADVLYEIYKTWKSAVESIADVEGLYPTFVMNIIPRGAARVGKTNGIGNVWGLDDDQPWIIWQISTGWALEQDDLRIQSWSRELITALHEEYKPQGITSEFIYMGDAGEWQDPFAGFPAQNVKWMKRIRSRYDQDGVFARLNWGGFKMGPSV
ncbi:hypothetical protein BJX96DRAFT_182956 [Aspergillus floccosus]